MTQKIRFGILGTGVIARKFAEGLRDVPRAELRAVGSRSAETAQQFANEYQVPGNHASYEALARDPDVDVIYIATPHNLHCENTLLCLENGKHVICEKPFAVNGKEVKRMIDTARRKNLFLMEALWSRFLPNMIRAKELVDSGAIGEVKLLECDFGINTPYNTAHRHFNRDLIGGSLLDIGIYPIFLSLFLFGVPQKVAAVASLGPTGVDHSCSMSFGYPGDLVSVLYSSVVAHTNVTATIHGTEGKIRFDKWWFCPVNISLEDKEGSHHNLTPEMHGNGYNYEAEEVVNCLLGGRTESQLWSWNHSLELIDLMDKIRAQTGIVYPGHDSL